MQFRKEEINLSLSIYDERVDNHLVSYEVISMTINTTPYDDWSGRKTGV